MSSKRRIRRRSCESKVKHDDQKAALAAIHSMRERNPIMQWANAYRCKFCGGWHVGRAPTNPRR